MCMNIQVCCLGRREIALGIHAFCKWVIIGEDVLGCVAVRITSRNRVQLWLRGTWEWKMLCEIGCFAGELNGTMEWGQFEDISVDNLQCGRGGLGVLRERYKKKARDIQWLNQKLWGKNVITFRWEPCWSANLTFKSLKKSKYLGMKPNRFDRDESKCDEPEGKPKKCAFSHSQNGRLVAQLKR